MTHLRFFFQLELCLIGSTPLHFCWQEIKYLLGSVTWPPVKSWYKLPTNFIIMTIFIIKKTRHFKQIFTSIIAHPVYSLCYTKCNGKWKVGYWMKFSYDYYYITPDYFKDESNDVILLRHHLHIFHSSKDQLSHRMELLVNLVGSTLQ